MPVKPEGKQNVITTTTPEALKVQHAPPIVDPAEVAPLEKLPFHLHTGEKIMRELKPEFIGFMLTRAFGSYLALVCLVILASVIAVFMEQVPLFFVVALIAVPLLLLIISVFPYISYGKSWYWITNQRAIGKRGFIGYSVDSIPLDNVTDVVISRTVLDRMLGLSSLIVVPMGGSAKEDGGQPDEQAQNANFFPALQQKTAKELQRVLFNLRDELRNSHTVQPVADAAAEGSSEAQQQKPDLPRGTK